MLSHDLPHDKAVAARSGECFASGMKRIEVYWRPARLAEALRRAGLTTAALAACVGVEPRAVQRWRRGVAEPRASTLARICAATGREPEFFLWP